MTSAHDEDAFDFTALLSAVLVQWFPLMKQKNVKVRASSFQFQSLLRFAQARYSTFTVIVKTKIKIRMMTKFSD